MTTIRASRLLHLLLLSTLLVGCAGEGVESIAPAAEQDMAEASREGEESLQALGYIGRGAREKARTVADRDAAPPPPGAVPGDAGTAAPPAMGGRKLVRDVSLRLRVEDTRTTASELERVAEGLGGFVASLDVRRHQDLFHYSMVLRVPTGRLDQAVRRAKELADEVEAEHRGVQDVTDRYVDLEARARTLEATEAELQALLAEARQRKYDATQVMAVYERLVEIRTRIEQIRGQLKVLEDQTSLGTLRVELSPTEAAKPVAAAGWRPGDTAKRSLRGLVVALRFLGDLLIVLVIQILPVLLLVALPLWAVARWWRRTRPIPTRRVEGGPERP